MAKCQEQASDTEGPFCNEYRRLLSERLVARHFDWLALDSRVEDKSWIFRPVARFLSISCAISHHTLEAHVGLCHHVIMDIIVRPLKDFRPCGLFDRTCFPCHQLGRIKVANSSAS